MKVTKRRVWTPVTIELEDSSEQARLDGVLSAVLGNSLSVTYSEVQFARVLLAELRGRRESASSEKPGPTIGKW